MFGAHYGKTAANQAENWKLFFAAVKDGREFISAPTQNGR